MTQAYEAALEVAFPSQCVGCGGAVEESEYAGICRGCSPSLQLIADPKCLTCGFPFFGETESREHCMHCEHLLAEFRQGSSMALFRGPLRELLYALKYRNGLWALRDIRRLADRVVGLPGYVKDAVLVPVPLHPRKLRERGYNQSELIVAELVSLFPSCASGDVLERSLDTVSQTQFDRRQRIRNLKNAFSLRQNRAIDPAQRYIIVDDVFTTGSTVNACAATLRRAGARAIDVLTVGHG
ncbi:ComF family protein [Pelagicoccus mobilis]|uniref:ComF family protein n=1 Tax=Pelagicoccus mobilis TaxID=415221 RepID=UPI001908F8FA|nr:ComF family protein [Pelagicoccus mobilis]